jgi:chaperone modulatory protein CbpM
MTLDELCREVAGIRMEALQAWIANDWVRPEDRNGVYRFEEIDVARVRLIVTLHEEMRVDEEAMPIVLSLLDQLHDTRRLMLRLQTAIDRAVPAETKQLLREHLRQVVVEAG